MEKMQHETLQTIESTFFNVEREFFFKTLIFLETTIFDDQWDRQH